jgi:hypothetical protein
MGEVRQGRILVELLGQVEIYLGEVQRLANGHRGMSGLRMQPPITWHMHVLYISVSVFMNYDCTIHPIALHYITTRFISKYSIKKALDTEMMNGYQFFKM